MRYQGRAEVEVGGEEEEARSRVEEAARWPENTSMIAGSLTVIQTSKTKPAKTAAAAAGPRWTLASAKLAAEEGRGGAGGYVGGDQGKGFAVPESTRRATGERVLVKMAAGGRR